MDLRTRSDLTTAVQSRELHFASQQQNISNTRTYTLSSLKAKFEQITKHRALLMLGFGDGS